MPSFLETYSKQAEKESFLGTHGPKKQEGKSFLETYVPKKPVPKGKYGAEIDRAAKKYDVDPWIIRGIIHMESRGHPDRVSPKGNMGLMQISRGVAEQFGVTNPHDPEQNIMAGTGYYAQQKKTFKTIPLALAAYNAGPGAVRKYKGIPPYRETEKYVPGVMTFQEKQAGEQSFLETYGPKKPVPKGKYGAEIDGPAKKDGVDPWFIRTENDIERVLAGLPKTPQPKTPSISLEGLHDVLPKEKPPYIAVKPIEQLIRKITLGEVPELPSPPPPVAKRPGMPFITDLSSYKRQLREHTVPIADLPVGPVGRWMAKPTAEVEGIPAKMLHGAAVMTQGIPMLPAAMTQAIAAPKEGGAMALEVGKDIIKHYTHPIESFKEDPFATLIDWTILLSVAGAGLKLGGKVAAKAGNIERGFVKVTQANEALEAGNVTKAGKLFEEITRPGSKLMTDPNLADAASRVLQAGGQAAETALAPSAWLRGGKKAVGRTREWAKGTLAKEEPGYLTKAQKTELAQAKVAAKDLQKAEAGPVLERMAEKEAETAARVTAAQAVEAEATMSASKAVDYVKAAYPELNLSKKAIREELREAGLTYAGPAEKVITTKKGTTYKRPYEKLHRDEIDRWAAERIGKPTAAKPVARKKVAKEEVAPEPVRAVDMTTLRTAASEAIEEGARSTEEILTAIRKTMPDAQPGQVVAALTHLDLAGELKTFAGGYMPPRKIVAPLAEAPGVPAAIEAAKKAARKPPKPPSPKPSAVREAVGETKPIGSVHIKDKDSTGAWRERDVPLISVEQPANVRGKVSGGNWAVRHKVIERDYQGKSHIADRTEYFWRKAEANKWISEVTAAKPPKPKPPVKEPTAFDTVEQARKELGMSRNALDDPSNRAILAKEAKLPPAEVDRVLNGEKFGLKPDKSIYSDESGKFTGNLRDAKRNMQVAIAKSIEEVATAAERVMGHSAIDSFTRTLRDAGVYLSTEDRLSATTMAPYRLGGRSLTADLMQQEGELATRMTEATRKAAHWAKGNLPNDTRIVVHNELGAARETTLGKASVEEVRQHLSAAAGHIHDPSPVTTYYRYDELLKAFPDTVIERKAINKVIADWGAFDTKKGQLATKFGLMDPVNQMDQHLTYVYQRYSKTEAERYLRKRFGLPTKVRAEVPVTKKTSVFVENQRKVEEILAELDKAGYFEAEGIVRNRGPFTPRKGLGLLHQEALGFHPAAEIRMAVGGRRASMEIGRASELWNIANDRTLASSKLGGRFTEPLIDIDAAGSKLGSKYKVLEGMHTDHYTSRYLQGLVRNTKPDRWEGLVQAWKQGKTMSPMFHFRNFAVGNPMQMYFGTGALPHELAAAQKFMFSKAGRTRRTEELAKRVPWYYERGPAGDIALEAARTKATWRSPYGKAGEVGREIFRRSEGFYKELVYNIERNRQNSLLRSKGLDFKNLGGDVQNRYINEAVQLAEDTIFDYSLRPQWLETAVRKGIMPFGTWPYKMAGLTAKTAVRKPARLAVLKRFVDMTSEWIDCTYFIPFAEFYEAMGQPEDWLGRRARDISLLVPAVGAGTTAAAGYDPFFGRKIVDERDPAFIQARDRATAMYRFLSPSIAPPVPPMITKGGTAWERGRKFADEPGLRRGVGLFGINIPDKAEEAKWERIRRNKAVREYKANLKRFLRQARRDNLSPAEIERGKAELKRKMQSTR